MREPHAATPVTESARPIQEFSRDVRARVGDRLLDEYGTLAAGIETTESLRRMEEILGKLAQIHSSNEHILIDPETRREVLHAENALPVLATVLRDQVTSMLISPDCSLAILDSNRSRKGANIGYTQLIELLAGPEEGPLPEPLPISLTNHSSSAMAFSSDSRTFACGQWELKLFRVDRSSAGLAVTETASIKTEGLVKDLLFAPDGKRLAVLHQKWRTANNLPSPTGHTLVVYDISAEGDLSVNSEYSLCKDESPGLCDCMRLASFSPDGSELSFHTRVKHGREPVDAIRTISLPYEGQPAADEPIRPIVTGGEFCGTIAGRAIFQESGKRSFKVDSYDLVESSSRECFGAMWADPNFDPRSLLPEGAELFSASSIGIKQRAVIAGETVIVEDRPHIGRKDNSSDGTFSPHTVHVLDGPNGERAARVTDRSPGLSAEQTFFNSPIALSADGSRLLVASPQVAKPGGAVTHTVLALYEI